MLVSSAKATNTIQNNIMSDDANAVLSNAIESHMI